MAGYRTGRAAEDITRELTAILRTVKDPRVSGRMLSVVRAEVAGDLSVAKVFISAMEGFEVAQEAVKGLESAAGYIRTQLGQSLKLRHVPALKFVADDSIAYGARIAETLKDLES